MSTSIALLRLYKTVNRFAAVYFKDSFVIYSMKFTRNTCAAIIIIPILFFSHLVFSPCKFFSRCDLLALCQILITSSGILSPPGNNCAVYLTSFNMIFRLIISFLGIFLGSITALRLRYYLQKNKMTQLRVSQERTLIVQVIKKLSLKKNLYRHFATPPIFCSHFYPR